jgi:hypothetical protein
MRNPWSLFASASLVLVSAHGAAAPPSAPAAPTAPTAPVVSPPSPPAIAPAADPLIAASEIVDRLQAGSTGVRHRLQAARAQRDVIKIICLNDKLNQLDVAARAARDRRESLVAAVAHQDADLIGHERVRLEALREQGLRVIAEANQCIGQPDPGEHETGGNSFTSPALPEIAEYPGSDVIIVQPVAASAVK